MTTTRNKPSTLAVEAAAIPYELRELDQWVCWRWEYQHDRKKWTKPPYQISGELASTTDPSSWTTFAAAVNASEAGALPVAVVEQCGELGAVLGRPGLRQQHLVRQAERLARPR